MELIIAAIIPVLILIPLGYLVYKRQEAGFRKQARKPESESKEPLPLVPVSPVRPQSPPLVKDHRPDDPIIQDAKSRAREIVFASRGEALKIRKEAEDQSRRLRIELTDLSKRLEQEKQEISQRASEIERQQKDLALTKERLLLEEKEINEIRSRQTGELTKIASLTKEEAKRMILANLEAELSEEVARRIKTAEEKIKEEASRKAKEILVEAMRHAATDYVAEYTVSSIKLPDEELKGRIIGKEGRNIRTFELATGVDVDLDEPKEIRLSCFDPVRREIARVSLERLVADGRIQPARIEEVVEKTKIDIEKIMHEAGEKLAADVGVFNLPLEIIDLLGRFKYRFSYGQNMIAHTLEETKIGVNLAFEVGADTEVVRLACLLHDIGKVVTQDEGTHVQLGADLLKKFKFPEKVVGAVFEHHEDRPFSSVESVLVYLADAISGARPGARVEDIEAYAKRMKNLEETALSFRGVKSAFAISAGREIRVVVEPLELDDAACVRLAHEVAAKIEKEQTYPGQVKVTVIREVRATGIAK